MSQPQQITAIIYDRRGRVLSIGQNSYVKTHPLQALHARKTGHPERIYLHAEIAAIARCRQLDRAARILVTRWSRTGQPLLAKPCAVCQSAIAAAGITRVDHT
jgi:tRNA(Arg) A34 adenosine deaminase TadA